MLRLVPAVLATLLLACHGESPTSPGGARPVRTERTTVHGITVLPDTTVVQVGKTVTVQASTSVPRARRVPFTSDNPAVATVSGGIEEGALDGTLRVTGVAPGTARITYTLFNLGRPAVGGSPASIVVNVAEPPSPQPCVVPSVTTRTAEVAIRSGERASLSVVAEGTGPISYQWYENGAPLPRATSRIYDTPPLTASTTYTAEAKNACGKRSSSMTVTVLPVKRRAAGQ